MGSSPARRVTIGGVAGAVAPDKAAVEPGEKPGAEGHVTDIGTCRRAVHIGAGDESYPQDFVVDSRSDHKMRLSESASRG